MIELWSLGREDKKELSASIDLYKQRLKHYTKFDLINIDNTKLSKLSSKEQMLSAEAELVLSKLKDRDILVTLDENGKSLTSMQFSEKLNQWLVRSPSKLIFLIGGSYGISEKLHQRADTKLSISTFTFPHQLVRLIFTEQLYRAFTILKNEKYHHE